MIELIEKLCCLDSPSGAENSVRDFILAQIEGVVDVSVDRKGNIVAFKKGKKAATRKILIDAHMDEVGLIATAITSDGLIKFDTIGGIEPESLVSKRVKFLNGVFGVIGIKPIHLCDDSETQKMPNKNSLYIDICAKDKTDALKYVQPGDMAVFDSEFIKQGDYLISKALDDRIGCAVLINLLKEESEYDFYATFTVGEEIGLVGAKTVTFDIQPEAAIVVESTTAGDIGDVTKSDSVCQLGDGAVVSFMDRSTLYEKTLFQETLNTAKEQGINCQVKRAVAGGNNAGAIHQSGGGIRSVAISVPCRYIHSPSGVVRCSDIEAVFKLCRYMVEQIASGQVW